MSEDQKEPYDSNKYTQSTVSKMWEKFLTDFFKNVANRDRDTGEIIPNSHRQKFVYKEQIDQLPTIDRIQNHYISHSKYTVYQYKNSSLAVIDYEDLDEWSKKDDGAKEIMFVLQNDADLGIKALHDAAMGLLKEYHYEYAQEIKDRFEVSIANYNIQKEIPEVSGKDVGKLLRIEGFISGYDDKRRQIILRSYWNCDGKNADESVHESIVQGGNRPMNCSVCESKKLYEDEEKRDLTDFIDIKIQQRLDRVREGSISDIDARLVGSEKVAMFYDQFDPGSIFNATVIPRLFFKNERDRSIADMFLEVVSIDKQPDNELVEHDELLDEVVQTVPHDDIREHVRKLVRSIAPSIMGLDHLKFAILLALAGAEPTIGEDYSRIRGTLKILIVGDTSSGKSTILRHAALLIPKSVYVSVASTAVGLVAGISIEDKVKKVTLGVLPMANNGLALIDELDKKTKDDLMKLSEPMDDDEMIYMRKAGITKPIMARCTIIAASNVITNGGRMDPMLSLPEQTDFPSWFLSRFDLVFAVRNLVGNEQDKQFLEHMKKVYVGRRLESEVIKNGREEISSISTKDGDIYQTVYMRHEFKYLKSRYKPTLKPNDEAWQMMMEWYIKHKNMIIPKMVDPEDKVSKKSNLDVPMVDPRKIRTLQNLAAGSARLFRRDTITSEDMLNAINILETSISSMIPESESINWDDPDIVNLNNKRSTQFIQNSAYEDLRKFTQNKGRKVKAFIALLKKYQWKRCDYCKGEGQVFTDSFGDISTGGRPTTCDECSGKKGYYEDFDFDILADQMTSTQGALILTRKDCEMVFKLLKTNNFFKQNTSSAPGRIRYNIIKNLEAIDLKDQIDRISEMRDVREMKQKGNQPEKKIPKSDINAQESVDKELEAIQKRRQVGQSLEEEEAYPVEEN